MTPFTVGKLLVVSSVFAVGCGSAADAGEPSDSARGSSVAGSASSQLAVASIAGRYFFQINTERGEIVGNWSFHADGTFFSVSNQTEIPAGTWTSDGTKVVLVQSIPYGNVCHYEAPITTTGFASRTAPSTQATCTFNHLKPNPRKSWYALKL